MLRRARTHRRVGTHAGANGGHVARSAHEAARAINSVYFINVERGSGGPCGVRRRVGLESREGTVNRDFLIDAAR